MKRTIVHYREGPNTSIGCDARLAARPSTIATDNLGRVTCRRCREKHPGRDKLKLARLRIHFLKSDDRILCRGYKVGVFLTTDPKKITCQACLRIKGK